MMLEERTTRLGSFETMPIHLLLFYGALNSLPQITESRPSDQFWGPSKTWQLYMYIYIYICIYICYYQGEPTGSNSKEVRAHGHWHFAVVVRAYDSDWWAQRINRMIQLEKMQMQSVIIGCDTHRMMMRTLLLTKNIMVFVYYYVNY